MDSLMILLIIVGLVLINGIFVGAEFALIRTPLVSVEALAGKGSRVARMLARILRSPRQQDRYIVTTQLGVTGASIGLGMYGEHKLAEQLVGFFEGFGSFQLPIAHSIASVLALTLCVFLHVVLGEMVPKSLALGRPQGFSLAITPLVVVLRTILFPLVIGIEWISNRLLRVLGVQRRMKENGHGVTPDDLRQIVERSSEAGALQGESGAVLSELFEFSELTAGEVMVPRVSVQGIPVGCEPDCLASILSESRHTRYPIFDGDLDHILGTAHVKDLIRLLRAGSAVERGSVRSVPFIPETSRLETVLATLQHHRTHIAVVMDEHGGTAGLVTAEDIFEEVVDIPEEGEPEVEESRVDAAGLIEAAGTLRLDELGDLLDRELEHEEADTVSGLILMLLDRPAKLDDEVEWEGLHFKVTAVEGRGVGRCVVQGLA